jgi:hypothetical protein
MDIMSASVQVSKTSANNQVWKHNHLAAKCEIFKIYCPWFAQYYSAGSHILTWGLQFIIQERQRTNLALID